MRRAQRSAEKTTRTDYILPRWGAVVLRPYREIAHRHECLCYWLVGGRGGCLRLINDLVDFEAEAFCYSGAVGWIGFVEMLDLQILNAARDAAQAGDDVANEALLGVGGHETEEIAWLGVVVGVEAMIVAVDGPG